ncbi:hypothetical protein MLD38_011503 [Melastoma candidum]|uniref:Uncharacterized protein n=1 Tax=Melastoma candidum TaxID=119954 RepID=A0ACB9RBL2_9MYRT|nr:hypothetical protein MLD38_011503 [Melastoma candidum]
MYRPNPLNRNPLPTVDLRRLSSHHLAALEDRAASLQRDINKLVSENQRLAAAHGALREDNSLAEEELRRLSSLAVKLKSDRDSEIREVYERSLKMESEVRAINSMEEQLAKVKADVAKLSFDEKEFTAQLQALDEAVLAARAESNQVPTVKAEIEALRKEILKGRAAIELEKKTRESNLEHGNIMERHMISMSREMEKLRADLANAEKSTRSATIGSSEAAGATYDSSHTRFGESTYM